MNYFIFFIIFSYITNWKRLKFLPKAIFNHRKSISNYPDNELTKTLAQKLKLNFKVKVQKSNQINGYMPGIPKAPIMIITDKAIKKLNNDELEFLILHEAGHCLNWHTLKDLILWITFLIIGILTIQHLQLTILSSIPFSLLLSIIWIQLERRHEIEADKFALQKGVKPEAMISFFQKMKQQHKNSYTMNKTFALLFSSHPYIESRIKMAQEYN